jgi:endonuclease/exonuclease/phosphatase (EEP) superfamily protein YafD
MTTRSINVSWDTHRSPIRGQGLLLTIAGLALIPAVTGTVLRVVPPTDDPTALIAAFIPYGLLAYLLAFVCLAVASARARRRAVLLSITSLVLILISAHVAWLAPLFVPDSRPATTAEFTLLSLNMRNGSADQTTLSAQAEQADIVILIETTPPALNALRQDHNWDQRYPYAIGDQRDDPSNTAIYSRLPLGPGTLLGRTSFQQWDTTVEVPQIGTVRLLAVHPCNPYCGDGRWAREHLALRNAVAADLGRPTIVAGDFNAVYDHEPMQHLRGLGLKSATDIVGAGWQPTYPANRSFPPLMAIDHVLVNSRLTATSITTLPNKDSDHLGLLAVLAGTQ